MCKNITCDVCGSKVDNIENVIGEHYYCDDACKVVVENSDECGTCGCLLQCDTGYNLKQMVFCDGACMGEYLDNANDYCDDYDYISDCFAD